ncbi:hypothetical protein [Nocardioides sp.]|uniref:hypothetical protein n=1 Tax=Nocardioides sp. TaxID=35761 RepID=UPI0025FC674F|nr:hypothetical protein [Nocardioides sp.]
MAIRHPSWPEDLLARLETGTPTGDPVVDTACRALLATGMTPRAIVTVLVELGRKRPMARTA